LQIEAQVEKENFHQFKSENSQGERNGRFSQIVLPFAVVALLAGLSIPAAAQAPFVCNTNAATPFVVRAEGYAELVGDLTLNCTGGTPTSAGQAVPQVQVQIILNTNITSKLLANPFNEALLIIDEPNAPGPNNNRPILNCGNAGAPDTSISGPGVCAIISNGNPQQTYDGTPNGYNGGVCDGAGGRPAANTYGCGLPMCSRAAPVPRRIPTRPIS